MERISKHISYHEGIRSNTALRLNINNTPTDYHLSNMENLAYHLFEPLREWVGGPIKITSFYRNEKLNKAIGGSSRSQHCEGRAIDIDDTFGYKTNAEMFDYIKKNLSFDKMIWEFGDDNNPAWVHVSYDSPDSNRQRTYKAISQNGRTIYTRYE
tara:strand:- start:363 stop:827 length:465 start_codon:yes stop_codon:yes gene_type:complete